MSTLLTQEQIVWIHRYNGYARLAQTPGALHDLIQPAREHFRRTGRVPDWCGTDFLRGWAFYLVRADRHGGGWGFFDREILAILRAHDAQVDERDRSPSGTDGRT